MEGDPQVPLDDSPEAIAARHRKTWLALAGVVGVVAVLLALYSFFSQPPPAPGSGHDLSAKQITNVMTPLVGRLESIGVSGQPQFAGLAVTVAQGEMATTCHSLPPGGQLEVYFHDGKSRAESARINRALDLCLLQVATTGRETARLRAGDPVNGEKLYVVAADDMKLPPYLVEARMASLIAEPNGLALKLEANREFASGAAVFDTQGRLVGIITSPHRYGDFPAALSVSRIQKVRESSRK
jgi:hypothetical protein